MLYGYFVQNDAGSSGRHTLTRARRASAIGSSRNSSKGELNQLLRGADKDDVAFSVASFSGTPVQTIRAAIEENAAIRTPRTLAKQTAGLAALC